MTEVRDRRAVPRTMLGERPAARVRGMRQVHVLDLSRTGTRIEHLDLLRLGAPCDPDFSLRVWALNLPAQVVWCTGIGRARRPGGGSRLVARSGLRFTTLTVAQDTALAWILNAQQRSAA